MVKRKATTELVESSEGLLPKEKVSCASNLEEEVTMQTLKLRPMRLNSMEATKLVESLTKLPSKEKVSCASNLEDEVAMQTLKLGSMRLIFVD